jgi:hypothetical protein
MLASELTLNDLRKDPSNADHLWARTAQLLTNALECLLLAEEEQSKGLAAMGLSAGHTAENIQLRRAISVLVDLLATFHNAGREQVEALAPPLATLLADLTRVESN